MSRKVIVVGDNALAREVLGELELTHDVCALANPDVPGALEAAGIGDAETLVAIDLDDRVNLDVALSARALNPNVRIVLSQFSRGLGHKLQQNLPNCSVVSPAARCAATFAAAALDPDCFYGLEFPEGSGRLAGFVTRRAAEVLPVSGMSVEAAEDYLGGPILACDGELVGDRARVLSGDEELVTFRSIEREAGAWSAKTRTTLFWTFLDPIVTLVRELDPLVQAALWAGFFLFVAGTVYFAIALKLGWITSAYFVVQTLTTVGYGDISLLHQPDAVKIVGMIVMFGGVVVTNLAVAFLSAALVRTQWVALQGLRRVHAAGHVVICGAGRVGTRVIEYLHGIGLPIVIVERAPDANAIRFGRERRISLLTGDAVADETIDLCDIERARSVVILTDNDAANLEVGLGVRARQADIPVIMRVNRTAFAERVRAQFQLPNIFSPVALAAPAIVGLAVSPDARGRLRLGGEGFAIEEVAAGADVSSTAILLATAGDRALYLTKLA